MFQWLGHRRAHPGRMRHRARSLASLPQLRHGHALERQRVEAAEFQECRVAAQLSQQRLDRGVLEHDACDQRARHIDRTG